MTPVQKEFFFPSSHSLSLSAPSKSSSPPPKLADCFHSYHSPIASAMPSAPAVVLPELPKFSPTSQQERRQRSPLANGSAGGDFELRHWRTPKKRAAPWAPPVIEIPDGAGSDDDSNSSGGGGGRHGYTSLRDILSSPEYAATAGGSPAACGGIIGGGCGSCGDIHMIRHPLVKHAAFAYLQMTPSAREDPGRRGRRWRSPLCRLLLGCLSFIGALFRP